MSRRVLAAAIASLLLLTVVPATAQEYHIINGEPSEPGEWPAMGALISLPDFQFCGGTLIDAEWFLTAAHCVADRASDDVADLEVRLDTTRYTEGGERIAVDLVVNHPEYDPIRTVNDLALLRLATPATTPPHRLPTTTETDLYAPGLIGTVVGYGATEPDGSSPSEDLLQVDVPLVDDESCNADYDGELVLDRHTCAGDPGPSSQDPGPDTCQGDSGGPLFVDAADGGSVLIGITSFGGLCGVQTPGVYTEVITYVNWISGIVNGTINPNDPNDPFLPDLPSGADVEPTRIVAEGTTTSDPVAQAIEISRKVFMSESGFAVLATSADFPDALGGSSLAYGVAPLLFTDADGALGAATAEELQRVVRPGGNVFILGGVAAVPSPVDQQVRELGLNPIRLAGPTREVTATRVAQQVIADQDGVPDSTMILATSGNWPDAVTAGQMGSWWGYPILLTPPTQLHPETAAMLQQHRPSTVLVIGGTGVVSDDVVAQVEAITGPGSVERLGGATRFETAAAVTSHNLALFGDFPPARVVAVNLRRDTDAFAHVLAATMLTGTLPAVFTAVEGDGGTTLPQVSADAICGIDLPLVLAGGTDLIAAEVVAPLQQASNGEACEAPVPMLDVGDVEVGSLTAAAPTRGYEFLAFAGQTIRIRVDDFRRSGLDPVVSVTDPAGAVVVNDDTPEGDSLNSLLEMPITVDGMHRIEVAGIDGGTGDFLMSLDLGAVTTFEAVLDAGTVDVVAHAGAPGDQIVVEMRRRAASEIDPVLFADDPATGEVLTSDDDGGGFPNARMVVTIPDSGEVDLVFADFDDRGGAYRAAIMPLPVG